MPDFSVLPESIVESLKEGGYDTPESVIAASEQDLWKVKGISRRAASQIKQALRDPLDVALDPFRPVATEFSKLFKQDYPDAAVVVDINDIKLTVGDFRRLAEALR